MGSFVAKPPTSILYSKAEKSILLKQGAFFNDVCLMANDVGFVNDDAYA